MLIVFTKVKEKWKSNNQQNLKVGNNWIITLIVYIMYTFLKKFKIVNNFRSSIIVLKVEK